MNALGNPGWAAANQRYLASAFAALQCRFDDEQAPIPPAPSLSPPTAIDTLTEIFRLSPFERDLLLLCAGVEMDSVLAARAAAAGAPRGAITFGLALGLLADPHWSALAPASPLRRFRLIDIDPGHGLTAAPLRIDERVLHLLAGVNQLDSRLQTILRPSARPDWLAAEHLALAATIQPAAAVLTFHGDDPAAQEAIAALIAQRAGRQLYVLRIEDTPAAGGELEQFLQLWSRDSLLLPADLLLQWETATPGPAANFLAERLPAPLSIASREPIPLHRAVSRHEVNKPGPAGQKALWRDAGGPDSGINDVAAQFRLSAATIAAIAASAPDDPAQLWNACRAVARPRLETTAQRIITTAGWEDLVLPPAQLSVLQQLAAQSRHRMTVFEDWGFGAQSRRGLGLSALFSGPSGTGKTLAAEVLANALQLDLYRIDLSAVVSKYIGETEKNLARLFDAAEGGGVLLLFDEADALFGKRAEVKDSHDRYANIEVGYLLQRMESFQGLAILTTNMKTAIDPAFQRRLRFAVEFPFPDLAQREAIWSRAFPQDTPTRGLDPKKLAALNMAGGNIRNIALNAAFLAAANGGRVEMPHILQAAQLEAGKIERPLSAKEIRGWL
jgi:hypothetical protein